MASIESNFTKVAAGFWLRMNELAEDDEPSGEPSPHDLFRWLDAEVRRSAVYLDL